MLNANYLHYYFLTEGVSNFGGAQLLVWRRAKFLQEIGLNVKIIVLRHRGDFLLEERFKDIQILYLPDLEYPFSYHSKHIKDNILKMVYLFLKNTNKAILETNSLQAAVWGEFIASKLKIKHIVYLLNDAPVNKYRYYPGKSIFYFKYNRGELFGTSDYSIELIFSKRLPGCDNSYVNVSFNPDELPEKTEPPLGRIQLQSNSKIICTVSRLEKRYIRDLIFACVNFADKYPEQNIDLLIGGGTIFKDVEDKLKKELFLLKGKHSCLKIHFTGYITKLGKDLFSLIHIFVGMGTASINAISQGCATLNIDPQTNLTSGIFGVDTKNFGYPNNGKLYRIEEKLFSMLNDDNIYNEAKSKGKELFEAQYTNRSCFEKLEALLENSDKDNSYYKFKGSISTKIADLLLLQVRTLRAKLKQSNLMK